MSKLTARAYSEVYEILQIIDEDLKEKIPPEVVLFFKENRDLAYEPYFDKYESLENQRLLNETINVLAFLKLKYWCTADEEKMFLKRLETNDIQQADDYDTIIKQNYYKKYEKEIVEESMKGKPKEERALAVNNSFLTKITNFFKNLFSVKK